MGALDLPWLLSTVSIETRGSNMRRVALIILGILSVGVLTKMDLHACGDKLLIGGRGVRYRLIHSEVIGSILLYKNPNLPKDSRIRDPKLSSALKDVGYKLTVAMEINELTADLKSGKYDLVIADP